MMERLVDLTEFVSCYSLLFLGLGTQYGLAKYHLQANGSLTTAVSWKPWLCIAFVRAASMPAASATLAMRSAYSRMALAITALQLQWTLKKKLQEREHPQLSGYQSSVAGFALDEAESLASYLLVVFYLLWDKSGCSFNDLFQSCSL